jgi:hypothetical protein
MTKRLLLLTTGLNVGLVLLGWSRPSASHPDTVIQAQRIDLIDQSGKVKGQLYLGEDGSGQIRLRSGKGEVAVKLGAREGGGSSLVLLDPEVEPGILLTAGAQGPEISARRGGQLRRVGP